MHTKNAIATLIAACVAAPAVPALAQSDGPVLEEILVQARRTEETQQQVPIAVSTVTAETLRNLTVSSISDIQRLVPSLQISPSNTGTQSFVIRGSFSQQFTDPGVITYVDEVPIDSRVLAYSLYDLGSIQQLKGPQGTLFGKNSTGGAVLFFSQRPEDEVGGYGRLRLGNFNERRVEGAINLPLTDTLAFRLAGQWEERDGFIDSVNDSSKDYDNRDNYALRPSLLWTPSDTVENFTQVTHYRVDQLVNPNLVVSTSFPFAQALVAQQQALGRDKTINNFAYPDIYDFDAITNTTTVELGTVSVKNIFHYSETAQTFGRDYDGTPLDIYSVIVSADIDNVYDELQVYGTALNDKLEWRVGGSYSKTDQSEFFDSRPFILLGGFPQTNTTLMDMETRALFGQVSYDLSTLLEGLTATAGYRHTWDERDANIRQFLLTPVADVCVTSAPNPDPVTCASTLDQKFDDYNYNLSLDWQINEDAMVYVAHRRGYKSGGFNTSSPFPELTLYQPEIVEDYELGLKLEWSLGTMPVRTNIAAFRADYENIQAPGLVINPVTGAPAQLIFNQSPNGDPNEAEFTGYEIEFMIMPAEWLRLSGFLAVVDTEYQQFVNAQGRDLAGEPVGGTTPKTMGLTANISLPAPEDWGEMSFTANYYGADKTEVNTGSTGWRVRRDQVDLRLDWRNIMTTALDLSLYGKNIDDREMCDYTNLGFGTPTELCMPPRQYGLELAYRFGQ